MTKFLRLIRYDWPMHFVLLVTGWLPDNIICLRFRGFLTSAFFLKSGKNLQIGRGVTFYDPSKITIGSNVYIAKGCWFSAGGGIEIQDNILFGPYVVVVTSSHTFKDGSFFNNEIAEKSTVIFKPGCWIGAHSTILQGVVVGRGSVVGANSLLNTSTEDFSIYAGVPAKFIKQVE